MIKVDIMYPVISILFHDFEKAGKTRLFSFARNGEYILEVNLKFVTKGDEKFNMD